MKKLFLLLVTLCATTAVFAVAQKDSTVNCGEYVKITATPKEGQQFIKWDDGVTDPVRTIQVTGNITLTALFKFNKYEIKWNNWDGTFIVKDSVDHGVTPTFPSGAAIKPKVNTAQYTYSFKGWGDGVTYVNDMVPAKHDTTYVAMFDSVINQYTLTYSVDPTGVGSITGTVNGNPAVSGTSYNYGSAVSLTVEADDDCYQFDGWYAADDPTTKLSPSTTYNPEFTGNVSLIAKFIKKQFKVTVLANPATDGDVDIKDPDPQP